MPRFLKYLRCILIGVPVWFIVGILFTFSPEISKELGVTGPVTAGKAVMYGYFGLSMGDLASGWLSQIFKSRRAIVAAFIAYKASMVVIFLFSSGFTPEVYYFFCLALGFGVGYWAVFATIAAEQFGTNLRATVTTSVPNFVRAAVIPLTLGFQYLNPSIGLRYSALAMGAVAVTIALSALWFMQETYGKDLDYIEDEA
jgi:MFS family permease